MTRIPGVPVTRAPLPFPLAIRSSLETRPSCLPSNFEFFFSEKKKKEENETSEPRYHFLSFFPFVFAKTKRKKLSFSTAARIFLMAWWWKMPIGRTRRIPPLWEEGRKEGSWILDASSFSMHINHRAGWGPRSRPFIKPAEICYAANLRVSPPPSPPPPPPRQPSTRRENVRTLEKSQLWISFWDSREENSFFVFSLSLSLYALRISFISRSILIVFSRWRKS